jgi:hypothetical protein
VTPERTADEEEDLALSLMIKIDDDMDEDE